MIDHAVCVFGLRAARNMACVLDDLGAEHALSMHHFAFTSWQHQTKFFIENISGRFAKVSICRWMHIAHTQSSVYRSDGKTVRRGGPVSPRWVLQPQLRPWGLLWVEQQLSWLEGEVKALWLFLAKPDLHGSWSTMVNVQLTLEQCVGCGHESSKQSKIHM